jgi:hypothetical protein
MPIKSCRNLFCYIAVRKELFFMSSTLNENPGCLRRLFPFLKKKQPVKKTPVAVVQPPVKKKEILPYRLRDDFLSPAEFSFYKVLASIVGPRLVILTKVRLADIFFVIQQDEYISYFNRIVPKHVDFLLCNPTTMKPIVGIELDDGSHSQITRQERDEFVDKVFEAAGLPLVRMPARMQYSAVEINEKINFLFYSMSPVAKTIPPTQNQYANPNVVQTGIPAQGGPGVPFCPKCGIPMVLRTATQGQNAGQQFYGCRNYPRCREIIMIKNS